MVIAPVSDHFGIAVARSSVRLSRLRRFPASLNLAEKSERRDVQNVVSTNPKLSDLLHR